MSKKWEALRDLRVIHHGIAVYPAGATFGPRKLVDFEFVWIIDGDAVARYDGRMISAPAGTILLSQPGMTDQYDWGMIRGTTHGFFHFDFQGPLRGWPRMKDWPLSRMTTRDDILQPLFRYILAVSRHPEAGGASTLGACLELMLRAFVSGQLQTAAEPAAKFPLPLEKALRVMSEAVLENPPRLLTLGELGRAAAVSPEHLCRLFALHLDLGPLECLRLMRLERAATLLSRSNMSAKEIAETTRFANPYHFSNAFKRVYGVSPSRYRADVRAGIEPVLNPVVRRLGMSLPSLR